MTSASGSVALPVPTTLAAGESLQYSEGNGFTVIDPLGQQAHGGRLAHDGVRAAATAPAEGAPEGDLVADAADAQQELVHLEGLLQVVAGPLAHHRHGIGIQAVGLDAGAVCIDLISPQVPAKAFRHLATAGIADAKKKDSLLALLSESGR